MNKEAVRTHVVLPRDLVEELDELVGPRHRSDFIAEAAKEKLRQLKLIKAAEKVKGWRLLKKARPEAKRALGSLRGSCLSF